MTPVLELTLRGKGDVVAVACGKCRIVALDREAAERCCAPRHCACGAPATTWGGQCAACEEQALRARAEARVARAPRVDASAAGWVYCDCCEAFFPSVEDALDRHHADGETLPTYAWACDEVELSIDAERVIEDALEQGEHHEDARDWLEPEAILRLQMALDAWLLEYAPRVRSYHPGDSVVDLTAAAAEYLTEQGLGATT